MKWDNAFTGLPTRVSEALTIKFGGKEREGFSLYLLTLMFGYLPGYARNPEQSVRDLEKRIEVLWYGILSGLFNNPRASESLGVAFFDLGRGNDANRGLHSHVVIALNEAKFRGKHQGSFINFWEREESRFINRPRKKECASRDEIVRSHLVKFDGSEAGIRYCSKSIGWGVSSRLGLDSVLYLGSG